MCEVQRCFATNQRSTAGQKSVIHVRQEREEFSVSNRVAKACISHESRQVWVIEHLVHMLQGITVKHVLHDTKNHL